MSYASPSDLKRVPAGAARSRLQRLRQMSLKELTGRSRHEAAKWLDRVAPGRWSSGEPARLFERRAPALARAGAPLEMVRLRLPARFFAGAETGAAADLLLGRLPNESRAIIHQASEICLRRFDLLGYKGLAFTERIDWHRDAVADVRALNQRMLANGWNDKNYRYHEEKKADHNEHAWAHRSPMMLEFLFGTE
jgi:hypothetical protein